MAKKQVATTPEATIPVRKAAPRVRSAKHRTEPLTAVPQIATLVAAEDAVAKIAYGYWESRGSKDGDSLADWFRAEEEFRRTA